MISDTEARARASAKLIEGVSFADVIAVLAKRIGRLHALGEDTAALEMLLGLQLGLMEVLGVPLATPYPASKVVESAITHAK